MPGGLLLSPTRERVVPASELAAAMKQLKKNSSACSAERWKMNFLKEAVEYGRAKKWIAHAPFLPGMREQLSQPVFSGCRVRSCTSFSDEHDDWMDGRRSRHTDDTDVLLRIHHVIGELPTYGSGRVSALLGRSQQNLMVCPPMDARKRVYRMITRMRCCLSEDLLYRHRNGHDPAEWP